MDGEPGDLVIRLIPRPHPTFERRQSGLLTNVTITLLEALTGFERELEHLDGHKVQIGSSAITRPGQVRWFKGEGMPIHDAVDRGDLWITYQVVFPQTLSQKQQEQVKSVLQEAAWHDEL